MAMTAEMADGVMRRMGKAIFKADRALLEGALTNDAEWHFAIGEDAPDGRVRKGVDGFLEGIADNNALFESLRFEEIDYAVLGDERILMTYRVEGRHRGGDAFTQRGVEIITVRDGRVAKKDVFWKQTGKGGG
ncbi:MAG: nuclear transport factor 2 family protein [Minwuia sp.]|uniref:nuclear transport factor 2 family protein n=1 Tax=Minwuia sp. TaxID=2493630 RepID=UPI003A89B4B9